MSDEKVVDFEEAETKKKGGFKKWASNFKKKAVYIKNCVFGDGPENDQTGNYCGGIIAGLGISAFMATLVGLATKGYHTAAIDNAVAAYYLKGQRDEAEKLLGDSAKTIIDSNNTEE